MFISHLQGNWLLLNFQSNVFCMFVYQGELWYWWVTKWGARHRQLLLCCLSHMTFTSHHVTILENCTAISLITLAVIWYINQLLMWSEMLLWFQIIYDQSLESNVLFLKGSLCTVKIQNITKKSHRETFVFVKMKYMYVMGLMIAAGFKPWT